MGTNRRDVLSGIVATAAAGSITTPAQAASILIDQKAGTASLTTEGLKLQLDRAQNWAVALTETGSGRTLTLPGLAPLFQLVLAHDDGTETVLSSSDAGQVRLAQIDEKKDLRLEFLRLGGRPIDIVCDIRQSQDGMLAFGATIRNDGGDIVRALRYPIVTLNPRPSDEDTFLLMPMVEVHGLLRNPHNWGPPGNSTTADSVNTHHKSDGALGFVDGLDSLRRTNLIRSPGCLSTQFCAYYDTKGGLYTAALDSKGWLKELTVERVDGRVRASWLNFFPELVTRQQVLDYSIVFASFTGDWYDAADIYKRWAHAQPWCAQTILQREDLPAWIKQGTVWVEFLNMNPGGSAVKAPDGSPRYYGDNGVAVTERWSAVLPHPPVVHYRFLSAAGDLQSLDVKPLWPSDQDYIDTLGAERAKGVRAWAWIYGYNLTVSAKQGQTSQAADFGARVDREAAPYATRDVKGQVLMQHLSWIPGDTELVLCRGTKWTRDFMISLCEEYGRVGFSLCEFDRAMCGGGDMCFAKDHGHPPGGGTWFFEAHRDLLKDLLSAGRRFDPTFHTSIEGPNELFIQELGAFILRDHAELPLFVSPQYFEKPWDLRIVPVFAYLYHSYAMGFPCNVGMSTGSDIVPMTEEARETVGVTGLAKSLIYGLIPSAWDYWFKPDEFAGTKRYRMLLQHAALTGGDAKRYLLFGKMLRPPPIVTDTVNFTFKYHRELVRDYPRVLHNAFEDASGKRAVFLVNVSDEEAHCSLDLGQLAGDREHLSEFRLAKNTTVRKDVTFVKNITVVLGPLEAMYLELG